MDNPILLQHVAFVMHEAAYFQAYPIIITEI